MLEGLDTVPWSELHHAYGPATDVPGLLRSLLADDPEVLDETFESLHATIWHQGTVYEASAYAVPFLIELLDVIQDKTSILNLLECLATGHSYADVHMCLLPESQRHTPEMQATVARELGWVRAAHDAVRKGLPAYLRLLKHENQWIQMYAAWLLARFPEDAPETAAALRSIIEQTANPVVKTEVVMDLGRLIGVANGFPADLFTGTAPFLEHLVQSETDRTIKLAAAVALVRTTKAPPLSEAIDTMMDALVNPGTYPDYNNVSKPRYSILPALHDLQPERSIPALLRALLAVSDEETAHNIAVALLEIAFGTGSIKEEYATQYGTKEGIRRIEYWRPGRFSKETPPCQSVTGQQHTVLKTLLDSESFWKIHTNLLTIFGLPGDREELRNFLDRCPILPG